MIEYWKKRWVPEKCPVCGAKGRFANPVAGTPKCDVAFVSDMLKSYYTGWHRVMRKHPKWGIDCWFGECAGCRMKDAMRESSLLGGNFIPRAIEKWHQPFTLEVKLNG